METNTANKGKKRLLIGLGLLATGVLSFFGYQYWNSNKKKTEASESNSDYKADKPKPHPKPKVKPTQGKGKKPTVKKPAPKPTTSTNTPPSTFPDYFPLKKGSQGERVKQLQQALINKYGSSVLPKGVTGIYDTDLQNALVKLRFPQNIDETTFNVLVQKKTVDASLLAKGLYAAIRAKSFTASTKILKLIKTTAEYTAVNKVFSSYFLNGVRQTLVNAMLSTFKTDAQKQEIRLVLAAMGLKYDGKKWSLEGLDGTQIITLQTTKVWKDPNTWVEVPKNMVLGREIAKRKEHTLFENDKQYFLVKSTDVGIFKN
jgi:hypothetical protein